MENQRKKRAVAAGHICLDITPAFPDRVSSNIGEILIPGRLLQIGSADVHTGGSVANTGLAMKILGADVTLMGKVGKDSFGELVLSKLKDYNASEGMLVSKETQTSYTVVLAPKGVDRMFLHCPGANDDFNRDDINMEVVKEASLFHFGYPPLMKNIYSDTGEQLIRIFKDVKALNVATSLDLAAVDENSPAGKIDWESIIKNVIPYVDFFEPSVEELAFMIDRERYHEWTKRANGKDITSVISVMEDVKPLADKLMRWGAKVLLIKCGAPGLYFRTNTKEMLQDVSGGFALNGWEDIEYFERSYKPDKLVSATGAGDTSIAAFLTAILDGYSWQRCLQLAAGTGASCVCAYDALSGLLPFDKLKDKIDSGWEKC